MTSWPGRGARVRGLAAAGSGLRGEVLDDHGWRQLIEQVGRLAQRLVPLQEVDDLIGCVLLEVCRRTAAADRPPIRSQLGLALRICRLRACNVRRGLERRREMGLAEQWGGVSRRHGSLAYGRTGRPPGSHDVPSGPRWCAVVPVRAGCHPGQAEENLQESARRHGRLHLLLQGLLQIV